MNYIIGLKLEHRAVHDNIILKRETSVDAIIDFDRKAGKSVLFL